MNFENTQITDLKNTHIKDFENTQITDFENTQITDLKIPFLPAFIILKILEYNTDKIHIYRRIFTQNRITNRLQAIMNTELYKWQYLLNIYPGYANKCLDSNNLEVVHLGIQYGATDFNRCLKSNELSIVQLGIQHGATNFNWCLNSDNL